MSTSSTVGFNISEVFDSMMEGISDKGAALTLKMDALADAEEISTESMMALQFEIGQYNAMMEALSSVTKSLTDMMKSLAQRSS